MNKSLSILVLLVFAQSAYCGTYGGGAGTAEEPFVISTAEDMQEVGANPGDWSKHFILAADIDLSGYTGTSFNIIGSKEIAFSGVFDGNGYAISNFTHNSMDRRYVGLFGYVGPEGHILNLSLTKVSVQADIEVGTGDSDFVSEYVGGLAGYNQGTIIDCSVTGSVSGDDSVGGLVGSNEGSITGCNTEVSINSDDYAGGLTGLNDGSISNCYTIVSISADDYAGGLVGANESSVTNCHSEGTISGYYYTGGLTGINRSGAEITNSSASAEVISNDLCSGGLVGGNWAGSIINCCSTGNIDGYILVGGLLGYNYDGGTVDNCYSIGNVSGEGFIGGLVGWLEGTITNCYSLGSVSGEGSLGGLIGYIPEGTCTNCFWNSELNPSLEDVATGDQGGIFAKTADQLKIKATFTGHNWDFVGEDSNGSDDIWRLCVDGTTYPRLAWEYDRIGDFVCPDGVAAEDMSFLAEHWLTTNSKADINGDDAVNLLDYYIMARYWLED